MRLAVDQIAHERRPDRRPDISHGMGVDVVVTYLTSHSRLSAQSRATAFGGAEQVR